MGFVKNKTATQDEHNFSLDFDTALITFKDDRLVEDTRLNAIKYLMENSSKIEVFDALLSICDNNDMSTQIYINYVFTYFDCTAHTSKEFDMYLKMLQSQNVYLRNMVIKYLQESDIQAKKFIKLLMKNEDKDLRIFAINVLGDVNFEESIDMLRYFIAIENDINAMMTAIDYLGEIGSEEDIELLTSVKDKHQYDPYVLFGIDTAIERIKI